MWMLILESRSKDVAIRVFDSRRSASTYVETLQASNWIILEIRKYGLMRVSTATPPPTTAQKLPETRIPPDALPYPLALALVFAYMNTPSAQIHNKKFSRPLVTARAYPPARIKTNSQARNYTMAGTRTTYKLSYKTRIPSLRHKNHVTSFLHIRY